MRIGDLRDRVTLQSVSTVADSGGGRSESYATLATVWAKVSQDSGAEAWVAQTQRHVRSWTVTIRHRTDVTGGMRVVHGSNTLEITGMRTLDDERNRWLELSCEDPVP